MAAELTPADAVRAIQAMTRVLDMMSVRLTRIADRMESYARWNFWLLAVILLATGGAFVVGIRTHAAQNDALRQVMQENRAIFERLSR